ncbi:MAG: MFS transporter [Flavobacteriales bacterium]|nr:MFS transporter [Flavobacteriales bacterium]
MIPGDKRLIRAWTMYDWANSAYSLTITSAIFPIYYAAITMDNGVDKVAERYGVPADSLQSYALSAGFLIVTLLAPILSGIADSRGNKLAYLKAFCKDLFTAVLEPSAAVDPATPLRVLSLGPDLWQLVGLPDGRHRIALFDAAGRVAARRDLNSLQGISEPFRLGALAPGLYIGVLDDDASRSFRIIHQP